VKNSVFFAAFKYSMPVLFGYITIGAAFGLVVSDAGYPWWLSLLMGVVMFAGAGQYIAIGLFTAGTGVLEASLIQLVVNARHMAYGLSMLNRYENTGLYRPYLIFGLTDETFALLSSLPEKDRMNEKQRSKFMFYVTALDQCYWIAGSVLGAVAGSLIPFNTEGIGFALTAMFVVLMIDKMLKERKPQVFIYSAAAAVLCAFFLPSRVSLLAALAVSLLLSSAAGSVKRRDVQ